MKIPFFNTKKKVRLSIFCCDFYDRTYLSPKVGDLDFGNIHNKLMKEQICAADHKLENLPLEIFESEILKIQFETFAVALLHQFGSNFAMQNSIITRDYLYRNNRKDIWQGMKAYNAAVAGSTMYGIGRNSASGREKITALNIKKRDLLLKLSNEGFDRECIETVINRIGTEDAWNKNASINYLTSAFSFGIKLELNEEAIFTLSAFIFGFYQGAKNSWEKIRIIN